MPADQTTAERGYNAYRLSLEGRTWDGRPMPVWMDLPEHIRRAWGCMADQVRSDTLHEVVVLLRQEVGEAGL